MSGPPNVETLVVLQPIQIDTNSSDQEARLVMADGRLIAILVRLEDPGHARAGHWFLEVGLGRLQGLRPRPFMDLEEATRWLHQRIRLARQS